MRQASRRPSRHLQHQIFLRNINSVINRRGYIGARDIPDSRSILGVIVTL